jgi:aminoglycoside 6-adenylyltransferase
MRSEQQMLDLILTVARNDERVRAVTLEGSRANPKAPKDIFEDYDIGFLVAEMDGYLRDPRWVDVFGERIIMQMPQAMSLVPPESGRRFPYLMLFTDGNRIDLTLVPLDEKEQFIAENNMRVVLLDKDGILPPLPAPTDEDYRVRKPTPAQFADCCNEFWWVSTYVAKGLWRREMVYAQEHLNAYMRPMLMYMLEWQVGFATGFTVSIGKCGKYLERYLPPDRWRMLLATYADGTYDGVWNALFAMGDLFRLTAQEVAAHLQTAYPLEEDRRVVRYLEQVRRLPRDAASIF